MKRRLELVVVTVVLALAVVLAGGWGRAEGKSDGKRATIECEAGAEVVEIGEGRIRVIGTCEVEGGDVEGCPVRPEDDEATVVYSPYDAYPEPAYPYPEVYPDPGDGKCEMAWIYGQECEE